MKKIAMLLFVVSAFCLGMATMRVWNNYYPSTPKGEKSIESVLVGTRSVHIIEELDLADPRLRRDGSSDMARYGVNVIVGIVAQGIFDLTKEGKLVYWDDQNNKLYCSLVQDDKIVAEVNIPSGWPQYNGADLVAAFRKAIILTPVN